MHPVLYLNHISSRYRLAWPYRLASPAQTRMPFCSRHLMLPALPAHSRLHAQPCTCPSQALPHHSLLNHCSRRQKSPHLLPLQILPLPASPKALREAFHAMQAELEKLRPEAVLAKAPTFAEAAASLAEVAHHETAKNNQLPEA